MQPAADGERWRGAHPSPGLRAVVRRRRVGAAERATGAVARVRALARDSERNRRCFVSVGTGRMLAAAFESLAAAALVCMMPLDKEAARVTKAAMVATTHLVSSDKRVATRVASTGLIPTLIEALVDADKSVSEKALAVFDAMLTSEEGRASARGHALAMPVLVKKMFRVSDVATELCRRHRSLGSVKGGAGEPVRTVRRKPTMGTGR
nr:U-box domain-containing protein 21 [Oryza sativa Japonica Group]